MPVLLVSGTASVSRKRKSHQPRRWAAAPLGGFLIAGRPLGAECSRALLIPLPHPTRFRLLAAIPFEVAFTSITYRLEILQVPVSGMWQLRACYPGGFWLCAYQATEAALRKDICEEGVELEMATVARVIFERLVKDGRAEVVA